MFNKIECDLFNVTVTDMPSYNKPSFPSPTSNQSNGFLQNGGTPVPKQRTTIGGKQSANGSPDQGSIRTNPLTAAFDTSDVSATK